MIANRLEALVAARAFASADGVPTRELVQALGRFGPPDRTREAWAEQVTAVIDRLRASEALDDANRLRDRELLASSIGKSGTRNWRQMVDRVLPALGLGLDSSTSGIPLGIAKLAGRDDWAAAIAGRALGLWTTGPAPSLPALCDALAWRELGLPGKPKRCPAEIRAVFVQRQLGSDAGPPERLVRLLAAREVGAPRAELRVLRDALVRMWLSGRTLGGASTAGKPFADEVREAVSATRNGFGDRKVFIASVWDALRRQPTWSSLTLDDFKRRLSMAHRAGAVALARADQVAAMDPELVGASEITVDGARFHFILRETSS